MCGSRSPLKWSFARPVDHAEGESQFVSLKGPPPPSWEPEVEKVLEGAKGRRFSWRNSAVSLLVTEKMR